MTGRELHTHLFQVLRLEGEPAGHGSRKAVSDALGISYARYRNIVGMAEVKPATLVKLARAARLRVIFEVDGSVTLEAVPERGEVARRRKLLRQVRRQVEQLPGFELVEVNDD